MSLANAATVLHWLRRHHPEVAVGELSAALNWPKSSTSRLLKDMSKLGLLERDRETQRYRVGLMMLELGRQYLSGGALIEKVDEELQQITLRTGYSSGISIRDGTDIVVVRSRAGTNPLRIVTPPGTRGPAWANSTGRCLLARLSDAEIADLFTPFPPQPQSSAPENLEELMKRITRTRLQGWDESHDESLLGISGISVAIDDPDSGTLFAPYLAFSGIQVGSDERKRLTAMLVDLRTRLDTGPPPSSDAVRDHRRRARG